MTNLNGATSALQRFGFSFDKGGPHLARTMMLDDLAVLLGDGRIDGSCDVLLNAIKEDNVLGKRSAQSRKLAARHLRKLYGLDQHLPLYRAFSYLWQREEAGGPLLALLVAYARDAVLRSSAAFILPMKSGEQYERAALEAYVDERQPGRFSSAMLKSAAQNIAGTWTQSGHLSGRIKKTRHRVDATPASIVLAVLLSFVEGGRGQLLFESKFVKLLDCSPSEAIALAERAARKGWINFKRVGSVMEVDFPRLLSKGEREWFVE